jgi:hypothetical protein
MGFLRNLLKGGPQYMSQESFNSAVLVNYQIRSYFDSFESYWNNEIVKNGHILSVNQFNANYFKRYPNDNYLKKQFKEASLLLDNHLLETQENFHKINPLIKTIAKLSMEILPNGTPIKKEGALFSESHPDPKNRVKQFIQDFKYYESNALMENLLGNFGIKS